MSMKRYALRWQDSEFGPGSSWWQVAARPGWFRDVPAEADLMDGPAVTEMAKRHPHAEIVDVVVWRARAAAWWEAFRGYLEGAGPGPYTPIQRAEARARADAAVAIAGYRPFRRDAGSGVSER